MIIGSLYWTGGTFLGFLLITAILFLLLRRRNWVENGTLGEAATRLGEAYVGETEERQSSNIREMVALFLRNIRVVTLVYVLALLIVHVTPGMTGAPRLLTTLLTLLASTLALWMLLGNSFVVALGAVLTQQMRGPKEGPKLFWASVLPHGPLELLGFSGILGHSIWLVSGGEFQLLGSLAYMAIAILACFGAAAIEVNITPALIAGMQKDPKEEEDD